MESMEMYREGMYKFDSAAVTCILCNMYIM